MVDFSRIQKELKEIERDKASGVQVIIKDGNLQRLVGIVPGPKDTPYESGLFKVEIELASQYPFVPPKMRFTTKVWHPNVSSQSGAICLDILKDQWVAGAPRAARPAPHPCPPSPHALHTPRCAARASTQAAEPRPDGGACAPARRPAGAALLTPPSPPPRPRCRWSPALTLKTALLSLQALLASPQPDDPQDAVVAKQYISDRSTFDATAKYWSETFANPNQSAPEEKVRAGRWGVARCWHWRLRLGRRSWCALCRWPRGWHGALDGTGAGGTACSCRRHCRRRAVPPPQLGPQFGPPALTPPGSRVPTLRSALLRPQVQMIVEMGFSRELAIQALQAADGDESAALESLLGGS
jgi:ubiquitin-protein ligase